MTREIHVLRRLMRTSCFLWIWHYLLLPPAPAQAPSEYTPAFSILRSFGGAVFSTVVPPGYSLFGAQLISAHNSPSFPNPITNLSFSFPPDSRPYSITKLRSDGTLGSAYFTPTIGWTETNMTLLPGEGAVVWNPGVAFTNYMIGSVVEGFLTNELPAGLTLCSSCVPLSGLLTTELGFPASAGDAVFLMQADGSYRRYVYSAGGWLPEEPGVRLSEAFWSHKLVATNWVQYLSVFGVLIDSPGYVVRSFTAGPNIDTNTLHQAIPYLPVLPGRIYAASFRSIDLRAVPANAAGATYQWKKDGVALTDGLRLTGTQSSTLSLTDLQLSADDGVYTVVATNLAGRATAHMALLQVVTAATESPVFNLPVKTINTVEHVISVQSGAFYRVQTSADLQNWIEVTNFTSASSTFQLSLPAPTNNVRHFYRLASP